MSMLDVLILPIGLLTLLFAAAVGLILWNDGRPDRRG
jgi:hypothetical protein